MKYYGCDTSKSYEKKTQFPNMALRKTGFSELFVFASFGNVRFLKIRVGTWNEFFELFPNSSLLAKTCSGLKLDSKVRLKVQNAGPYFLSWYNCKLNKFY
jgi:hypothetical protein